MDECNIIDTLALKSAADSIEMQSIPRAANPLTDGVSCIH